MTNGTKWRIAVALILVFLAGIAVGVFGTAHHVRRLMFAHHPPHLRGRMAEHLRRELALTPEQFGQVRPIVDRSADRLEKIREETNQRVHETIRQAHGEIVPYLTPEQRTKLAEMAERHRRALSDGAPPPPP
jgi:Spy/CpxP family protein refolding chaperone